jgi:chromatin segregation and condensation protein Rec8/ScpA/Scc1 (kleisin family)
VVVLKESGIMKLITQDYSWEQVLYKIIAWEGLDPWDLDIGKLSGSFVQHIEDMEELDFKVPAKYIIIAAVLLRMKSEHLHFIDWLTNPEAGVEEVGGEIEQGHRGPDSIEVNPITVPPVRYARRKVMANELVMALRKVLNAQEKRQARHVRARKQIKVSEDNITERISQIYDRISALLAKIEEDEVKFSSIVNKWERKEIIDAFVPMIYLDNEKKISCRQEEMFKDIFVSHPPEGAVREAKRNLTQGERIRRLVPAV